MLQLSQYTALGNKPTIPKEKNTHNSKQTFSNQFFMPFFLMINVFVFDSLKPTFIVQPS